MKKCPKCNWDNQDEAAECANCGYKFNGHNDYGVVSDKEILETTNQIKIYTAPIIDGVKEHIGVVSYEVIFGANIFKDIFASVTDFIGGRGSSYEAVFRDAKDECIKKVKEQCYEQGGNSIINLKIEFLAISESKMLMCYVSGTSVVI